MESDDHLMQASQHMELAYKSFSQRLDRQVCVDLPNGRIRRVLAMAGELEAIRRITEEVRELAHAGGVDAPIHREQSLPKGLAQYRANMDGRFNGLNAVA
jgi:hypothetical protein